jgi:hypothetical protein
MFMICFLCAGLEPASVHPARLPVTRMAPMSQVATGSAGCFFNGLHGITVITFTQVIPAFVGSLQQL